MPRFVRFVQNAGIFFSGCRPGQLFAEDSCKIGVEPEGKMAYELADGTIRELPFGLVRIEFMGETTAGRVVFTSPGTEPVGIMVDPATKTLRRLPAIPLK